MKFFCQEPLFIENFIDLNIEIRSNLKIFLELFRRIYSIFFIPQVNRYYKKKFGTVKNVRIDIIFSKDTSYDIMKVIYDVERHIKYLLWGRFMIFHASSVRYNNFNLLFMGESKIGKSTMCSALWSCGGMVLSEDCSLMNPLTKEIYMYPSFIGNIRSDVQSDIQRKYLSRLKKYERASLYENIISMNDAEFKILLDYHKELYGVDRDLTVLDSDKNVNIFILLGSSAKNKHGKEKILIRKKPIEVFPDLMKNVASNREHYSKLIKENIELFLDSECYVLKRAPLDLMASAVCSRFGQDR